MKRSSYMVSRDEHDRLSTARPPGTGVRSTPLYRNFPAGCSTQAAIPGGAPGGSLASYGVDGTLAIHRGY